MTAIKIKLIEEFGDQVPNQLDFSVGYYDGSQQSKTWVVTNDDYIYATQILELAKNDGVLVANSPAAIRNFNEKIFATESPKRKIYPQKSRQ